jgi:rhodanese-related sulfurtransferase
MAQDFLLHQGYTDVINIEGGIDAWSLEIDSTIPRY